MENNARTAESMLNGGYVGKIRYIMNLDDYSVRTDEKELTNVYYYMCELINSINDKGHICPNDITNRFNTLNENGKPFYGSILYSISPLAFADIFGLYGHDLDNTVKSITSVVVNEEMQMLCIEYIHLLHDILWFKIDKKEILEILPEIDVLESEVQCSRNDKDIFFAALWSFIFSEDYITCFDKAFNLKNTNSDIVGVACTIAGLYYGKDSIPSDWMDDVFGNKINDVDATEVLKFL